MAGIRGSRSGLFFTVAGLLKSTNPEDRPQRLIVENVKHLLSSEKGGAFTAVLTELWEAGYDCEWQAVNSKDFEVPQHRERVYLVGHLGGIRGRKVFPVGGTNPAAVRQILDGSQGNRVYDPDGVSVTIVSEAGGFGGKTGLYAVSVNRKDGLTGEIDYAKTLTASDFRGLNRNQDQNAVFAQIPPCATFIDMNKGAQLTDNARCLKAHYNAGIGHHRGETSGVFICQGHPDCVRAVITPNRINKRQNGRRMKESGEPSFTLTTQDQHGILLCCYDKGLPVRSDTKSGHTVAHHGDGINLTYPNSTARRGRVGKQCAQTLLTSGSMGVLLCCRIRRLTPKEAWRLQAFEDYLFERARAAGISDAQLYRQAGNAVTVNIVYEIGLRLSEGDL